MTAAVKLHITGKVQGVNFRYSTMQQAKALQLFGWVKNENDGSVTAFAQGSLPNVDVFIAWCKQGPEHAEVSHVVVEKNEPGDYRTFKILR